jgi:hypothetical protein
VSPTRLHTAILLLALLAVGSIRTAAQSSPACIDSLQSVHAKIMASPAANRAEILGAISEQLHACIDSLGAFSDEFAALDFMGVITSQDQRLRIWTWNAPMDDRTCLYAGLIAHRPEKSSRKQGAGGPVDLYDLAAADSREAPALQLSYNQENWPGALYYAMAPDPTRNGIYTLLGWDAGDGRVTRKSVEPLQIKDGQLRFGAAIFESSGQRYILEYRDQVQVTLRHEPREKRRPERIVFDHLAPAAPHLQGVTAFYGPDLTFDALVLDGKIWRLETDVSAIQHLNGQPFIDPRQAP